MPKSDIAFTMGLDSVAFQKAMISMGKLVENQTKAMTAMLMKTAGVLGVAFGVEKFGGMIAGSIESGKALDSLSRETGIAVEQIDLMHHALDRSGMSVEQTSELMSDLRDKIHDAGNGGTQANLIFKTLGIELNDFKKLEMPQQFQALATRINAIKEPIVRASTATALLGISGAKAIANFNAGDIERASKMFGIQGKAMQEAAPGLARASEAFKRIQEGGKMFFDIVVAKLAPVFETVATKLEDVIPKIGEVAQIFGEKLMEGVNILVEAFKEGKLGELLWLTLKAGTFKALDFLTKGFAGVFNAVEEMIGQAFSILSQSDFWSGMLNALIGVFEMAANGFALMVVNVFKTPLKFIQDSLTFVFEKAFAVFTPGMKARSFGEIQKQDKFELAFGGEGALEKNIEEGKKKLSEAGNNFNDSIKNSGANFDAIITAFQQGMKDGGIFGPEADEQMGKIRSLVDSLKKNMTPLKIIGSGAKPGETKGAGSTIGLFKESAFDSLRRVGGGIGAAGASVAQKSLDRLTEISKGIDQLVKSGGAKFNNSMGSQFSQQPVYMSP